MSDNLHRAVDCHPALARAVALVGALNLAYFFVEFGVAVDIRSVGLFADSIDFLEDASLNLLILIALSWSAAHKARLGTVLAGVLLLPSLAALWSMMEKLLTMAPPHALSLSLTGLGALAVNLYCALHLARFRKEQQSLTQAAFLSARNDALANIAIIVSGLVTVLWVSPWPDLLVGLGIFVINLDAAVKVYRAARGEQRALRHRA